MEPKDISDVFLVIPSGQTESTVRLPMQRVSEHLQEKNIKTSWIQAEDCLKLSKGGNAVFVCDLFHDAAYEHLNNLKCRILGPLVLLNCLKINGSLPRHPQPIYSLNMRATVITFSKIELNVKQALKQMVSYMGGTCVNSFTLSCTHLVVGNLGSEKYNTAVSRNLPIRSPEWILQCWSAAKEETCDLKHCTHSDYNIFACRPFHGLIISVSQFDTHFRRSLQSFVEENGGKYTGIMKSKETTHLVLERPSGDKFHFAKSWDIKCVTKEWIYDCISENRYLPEDPYILKPDQKTAPNKASTPKKDEAPLAELNVSTMLQCEAMNETCLSNVSFMPISTMKSYEGQKIRLADCVVFLLDCTPEERFQFESSCFSITTNFSDSVTHVVVNDPENLKTLALASNTVKIVSPNWLADCIKNGKRLAEEGYVIVPNNAEERLPKVTISKRELSAGYVIMENISCLEKSDSIIDKNNSLRPDQSMAKVLFSGMSFKTQGFSSDDTELLREILENDGGIVQTSSTLEDYVLIVPFIQEKDTVLPKNVTIRTSFWVEMCVDKGILLPVNSNRLFFPISLPNVEPLSGCILTFSQFTGTEKNYLMIVANELGATCSQFFVRVPNKSKGLQPSTHLILATPEGDKYVAAKKWGVPAVHKEWLYQAAHLEAMPSAEEFCIDKPVPEVPIDVFEGELQHSFTEPQPDESLKEDSNINADIPTELTGSSEREDVSNFDQLKISRDRALESDCKYKQAMAVLDARISKEDENQRKRSLSLVELANYHMAIARKNFGLATPGLDLEQLEDQSTNALSDVVICLSRKLASQQNKLHTIAKKLGAKVIYSYNSSCTHFIHQGKALEHSVPGIKDLRQALAQKKLVVSPDWLMACRDAQAHVDEQNFPYTYNPRLSLSSQVTAQKLDTSSLKDLSENENATQDVTSSPVLPVRKKTKPNANNISIIPQVILTKPSEFDISEPNRIRENTGITKQLQDLMKARKSSICQNLSSDNINPQISPRKWAIPILSEPEPQHTQLSQSCPIVWEDPTEKLERELLAQRPASLNGNSQENPGNNAHMEEAPSDVMDVTTQIPPKKKVFMLSGLGEEIRVFCMQILQLFQVEIVDVYSVEVTHIISDQPSKNEKVLCALAAGLWILHSSYLKACDEAGQFVDEEQYEWGNPSAKCFLEKLAPKAANVAKASHRWRKEISNTQQRAFSNWQVKLLVPETRVASYTRILEAGGADLVETFTKSSQIKKFAFIEGQPTVDIKILLSQNVACCKPEYFSVVLVENPPPPSEAYSVIKNRSTDTSGTKRKLTKSRNGSNHST